MHGKYVQPPDVLHIFLHFSLHLTTFSNNRNPILSLVFGLILSPSRIGKQGDERFHSRRAHFRPLNKSIAILGSFHIRFFQHLQSSFNTFDITKRYDVSHKTPKCGATSISNGALVYVAHGLVHRFQDFSG